MPSKARIAKLDQRLAALEAEEVNRPTVKAPGDDLSRVLGHVERMLHPALIAAMTDRDRAYFWPWWQTLRLLSTPPFTPQYLSPHVFYIAHHLADALDRWTAEMAGAIRDRWGEGGPPDEDPTTVADLMTWHVLNPCALHDLKTRFRTDRGLGPAHDEVDAARIRRGQYLGVEAAEQISHLFVPYRSPWDRDFDPNPEHWPADTRAEILRRLAASHSLPPAEVGPFDWAEIPVRAFNHPFPRDRDGRPLPRVFEDRADEDGA